MSARSQGRKNRAEAERSGDQPAPDTDLDNRQPQDLDYSPPQVTASGSNLGLDDQVSNESKPSVIPRIVCLPRQTCKSTLKVETRSARNAGQQQGNALSKIYPFGEVASHVMKILQGAPSIPPINKTSLAELDLPMMQNNLKLRVDLPYDSELYFQPVAGIRGDEKGRHAEAYWSSVILELDLFDMRHQGSHNIPAWLSKIDFKSRLKPMLETLKELIEMLVPESDKAEVQEHFDPDWLLWRISVGSFDMYKFSAWLIRLLMCHCAPMRDELALQTLAELQNSASDSNKRVLVGGLRKLFSLLEAMKLDVANHQIRTFVTLLIEDAVPFQRDCFQKMIAGKQLSLDSSRKWYLHIRDQFAKSSESVGTPIVDFNCAVYGLTRLCNPHLRSVPLIFHYDAQRLQRLHEDIFDLTCLNICMNLYKDQCSHMSPSELQKRCKGFMARLVQLMGDDDERIGPWIMVNIESVGTEIARSTHSTVSRSRNIEVQDSQSDTVDVQATIDKLRQCLLTEEETDELLESTLATLFSKALSYAKKFSAYGNLELSSAQRRYGLRRLNEHIPDMEDISRRVAHLAVMHWRVWEDLFYKRSNGESRIVSF